MKKILIPIIFILLSCKVQNNKIDCNENEEFKKMFFKHIENIDSGITGLQNLKFRESVIFISNYAPVSTDRIMNYSRTYPYVVYKRDREKWIKWYEENKCNNIQFKSSYAVPDVYDISE